MFKAFLTTCLNYPKDLAETCELRVLAACFEECQTRQKVSQYSDFISWVKAYLEKSSPYRVEGLSYCIEIGHSCTIQRSSRGLTDTFIRSKHEKGHANYS